MRKDTLARRAMALALLVPLATAACADEGIDEDLDTDFDATTEPAAEARGEQFGLEEMNDSGIDGEGWARAQGDSLVVTLNLEGQAATQELALFVHRGTCGDEQAPMVTEMQRDRMAGTGTPTATTPGQTGQTGAAEPGTGTGEDAPATGTGTGTMQDTGQMAGTGMTYTAPLSALQMGAQTGDAGTDATTGTETGMQDGMDEELSVRAHPAGTTSADLGAGGEEGRALFCGDLPTQALSGTAGMTGTGTTGTGTGTGTPGTTGGDDGGMR